MVGGAGVWSPEKVSGLDRWAEVEGREGRRTYKRVINKLHVDGTPLVTKSTTSTVTFIFTRPYFRDGNASKVSIICLIYSFCL